MFVDGLPLHTGVLVLMLTPIAWSLKYLVLAVIQCLISSP